MFLTTCLALASEDAWGGAVWWLLPASSVALNVLSEAGMLKQRLLLCDGEDGVLWSLEESNAFLKDLPAGSNASFLMLLLQSFLGIG